MKNNERIVLHWNTILIFTAICYFCQAPILTLPFPMNYEGLLHDNSPAPIEFDWPPPHVDMVHVECNKESYRNCHCTLYWEGKFSVKFQSNMHSLCHFRASSA